MLLLHEKRIFPLVTNIFIFEIIIREKWFSHGKLITATITWDSHFCHLWNQILLFMTMYLKVLPSPCSFLWSIPHVRDSKWVNVWSLIQGTFTFHLLKRQSHWSAHNLRFTFLQLVQNWPQKGQIWQYLVISPLF